MGGMDYDYLPRLSSAYLFYKMRSLSGSLRSRTLHSHQNDYCKCEEKEKSSDWGGALEGNIHFNADLTKSFRWHLLKVNRDTEGDASKTFGVELQHDT